MVTQLFRIKITGENNSFHNNKIENKNTLDLSAVYFLLRTCFSQWQKRLKTFKLS